MKTIVGILLLVCVGCSTIVVNSPDVTVNVTRVGSTNVVTISPKTAVRHRLVMDAEGRIGTVEIPKTK